LAKIGSNGDPDIDPSDPIVFLKMRVIGDVQPEADGAEQQGLEQTQDALDD
jgi:hypothetical protein